MEKLPKILIALLIIYFAVNMLFACGILWGLAFYSFGGSFLNVNDGTQFETPFYTGSLLLEKGKNVSLPYSGLVTNDRTEISIKLMDIDDNNCPEGALCDFVGDGSSIEVRFTTVYPFSGDKITSKAYHLGFGESMVFHGVSFKVTSIDNNNDSAVLTYQQVR